ncbi:DUF4214 domain-containing protein [Serratia inhibens]|uniref:DUF4214 domain-containing protein n=2 Tax=Serratia inhibens TaxID=2338073 RepID=A0AA92X6K2_9GAMM|nr:DUF4214 domain-containing protein [Serratia inhibens]
MENNEGYMASLISQKTSVALIWSILERNTTSETYEYVGRLIERGGESAVVAYTTALFNSEEGTALYSGRSDEEILNIIYSRVYAVPAEQQVIDAYLSNGKTIAENTSEIIIGLLSYSGTDHGVVDAQSVFDSKINKIMVTWDGQPVNGSGIIEMRGVNYLLGASPDNEEMAAWGNKIDNHEVTLSEGIAHFLILSPEMNNGTDEFFISKLFDNAIDRAPSVTEKEAYLTQLAEGVSRNSIISDMLDDLKNSTEPVNGKNHDAYIHAVTGYIPGELPGVNYQEQMVAIYLALPHRDIDNKALVYYGRILEKGKSYHDLIDFLIGTKEFQNKGANLNGIDYLKHVFSALYPNENAVNYEKLWESLESKSKSEIVEILLNEFRYKSDYSSELIVGVLKFSSNYYAQSANFEEKIGNILGYKTTATLSSGSKDYSVIGTVNTGKEHSLTFAELAILKSINLYAINNIKIDLTTAKNLMELNVYGDKLTEFISHVASTTQFVNKINLHGANITSSMNGNYHISPEVDLSLAKINFGFNNKINVFWNGNSVDGGANHVSNDFIYKGYGTISANLITKQITSTEINGVVTNTISSNIANFASVFTYDTLSLGWLDLGGYVGKTEAYRIIQKPDGSVSHETIATQNHTFDAGLINSPGHEGLIASVWKNNIPEVRVSNGNQAIMSFTLSKKADDVHVLNYWNRVDNYDLQLTGDVTSENKLTFHLTGNALYPTQSLGLYHTPGKDTYAGSINYISEQLGAVFDNFDIYSYGNDQYSNHLDLRIDAQVNSLSINGMRHLDLNINSYSDYISKIVINVSRGVDIDFKGGLKPSVSDVATSTNLDVITKSIEGGSSAPGSLQGMLIVNEVSSSGGSKFSNVSGEVYLNYAEGIVPSNTIIDIERSVYGSEVVINKFSTEKFSLIDQQSDIVILSGLNGHEIKDYGTILSSQTEPHNFNVRIGVGLSDKVGVFGYSNANNQSVKMSAIVIDNNDDHIFDVNDTLIIAYDVNSHDVANGMSYNTLLVTNGVVKAQEGTGFLFS